MMKYFVLLLLVTLTTPALSSPATATDTEFDIDLEFDVKDLSTTSRQDVKTLRAFRKYFRIARKAVASDPKTAIAICDILRKCKEALKELLPNVNSKLMARLIKFLIFLLCRLDFLRTFLPVPVPE